MSRTSEAMRVDAALDRPEVARPLGKFMEVERIARLFGALSTSCWLYEVTKISCHSVSKFKITSELVREGGANRKKSPVQCGNKE